MKKTSVSELNTFLNTPPSNSSVKATIDVEPYVEIARRAEVHVQVKDQKTEVSHDYN